MPHEPSPAHTTSSCAGDSAVAYQQGCLRTAKSAPLQIDAATALLLECGLGLAGEASEFADEIKKHVFHGHRLDRDKLREELGDTLWYAAVGAHALGLSLADVMASNLRKLQHRYPDGFDSERSQHRETTGNVDGREAPAP